MGRDLEERNKLKFAQLKNKANLIGEFDLDLQPKHWDPDTETEAWKTPDGTKYLKKYWAPGNTWGYFLQETDPDRFWFCEVPGPDHGLNFYGPFKGKATDTFEACKQDKEP